MKETSSSGLDLVPETSTKVTENGLRNEDLVPEEVLILSLEQTCISNVQHVRIESIIKDYFNALFNTDAFRKIEAA